VFGVSFEWQQDAVTFFILSGVFLYFGISQRHDEHLTVEVVPETLGGLGPRAQRAGEVVKLVARAFSLLFILAVCWWGIPEVRESIHYESRTESLAFPMWPFLATLLVGFAFMAVTMLFQVWFGIQKLRGRGVPDEAPRHGTTAD
jgi:TRAP-type C4-dicarboxylate transport system permease small subunit